MLPLSIVKSSEPRRHEGARRLKEVGKAGDLVCTTGTKPPCIHPEVEGERSRYYEQGEKSACQKDYVLPLVEVAVQKVSLQERSNETYAESQSDSQSKRSPFPCLDVSVPFLDVSSVFS
jgi:hypothetical protein